MSVYPRLVQKAHSVIDKFVRDWQKEPFRWSKEIDFQVEIASRLSAAYKSIKEDTVLINYPDEKLEGFKRNQKWNRVCCEPQIRYKTNGRKVFCYPDIIVWDDIKDPNSPPHYTEHPILWVCEIKINWKEEDKKDMSELRHLIKKGYAKYACWLNLIRERATKGRAINKRSEKNKRLLIWEAKIPKLIL